MSPGAESKLALGLVPVPTDMTIILFAPAGQLRL